MSGRHLHVTERGHLRLAGSDCLCLLTAGHYSFALTRLPEGPMYEAWAAMMRRLHGWRT